MKGIVRLEINFPVAVEVSQEAQRKLDEVAAMICKDFEAANPGRVMWPFGHGAKMTCHPIMVGDDEPIPFDASVYEIECAEREDYDWLCAKCGHKQGDHAGLILNPPAGECDFEAAKRETV